MLADSLFEKIGYTSEMIEAYTEYKKILSNRLEGLAELTITNNINLYEACKIARQFEPNISEYTMDLMFILECTGYLHKKYLENGLSDKMFYDAMIDIRCKTAECLKFKNVFGTFVTEWFNDFFNLKRLAFGRLQYDVTNHDGDTIKIGDFSVEEGDLVLRCHIPSSGPLTPELCLDSYKKAHKYFNDRLKNRVLIIRCGSYLLLPEYKDIFKECSPNIYKFIDNFKLFDVGYSDKFNDSWRIFNVNYDGIEPEKLQCKTKLQKGFKQHICNGGAFGSASGILLFDGEYILTKN